MGATAEGHPLEKVLLVFGARFRKPLWIKLSGFAPIFVHVMGEEWGYRYRSIFGYVITEKLHVF